MESRWLSTTSPPSLILDSDGLTPSAAATSTTRAGAYDPNATGPNVIRATLAAQTLVVLTTGDLAHVGSFRVRARVWAASATPGNVMLRLSHQAGAGPMRAGRYVTPPVVGAWSDVDLGLITIPATSAGTQRWTGRIEAYSSAIGDTIDIDVLSLVPAEAYGVARAGFVHEPGTLSARDEFTSTTSGGSLSGRAAPLGGSWTTSGVATDFAFSDVGGERVQRSTISEGSPRYAILGSTNATDQEVGVTFESTAGLGEPWVIARYVDSTHFLLLGLLYGTSQLRLALVNGGTSQLAVAPWRPTYNTAHKMRLIVYASGYFVAQVLDASGTTATATIHGYHAALATGGALASGKPGIADQNSNSAASTRFYDDFYAAIPAPEAVVIHPGRSIEITSDACRRQDATGAFYGNPPSYVGGRFFVPPAGDANRQTRIVVRARRNDIETSADDQIGDSITVAAAITPRYLAIPRA